MKFLKSIMDGLNIYTLSIMEDNFKKIDQVIAAVDQLAAEGQLTPEQYADLITTLNGLLKSGDVAEHDLTPTLANKINGVNDKISKGEVRTSDLQSDVLSLIASKIEKGEVSVSDINLNKGKLTESHLSDTLIQQIAGMAAVNQTPADDSVTTPKLASKAVERDKLNENVMVNLPWKSETTDDVDLIWEEGNTIVSGDVANTPKNTTILLNVKRHVTTSQSNLVWLTQTATEGSSANNARTYFRVLQFNKSTQTVTFKTEWREINGEITKDAFTVEILDYINSDVKSKITSDDIPNVSEVENILDSVNGGVRNGGLYGLDGSWIQNASYNSYKIPVKHNVTYTRNYGGNELTVVGFDESGAVTENLSNTGTFTVSNSNTAYIELPVHIDRLDSTLLYNHDHILPGFTKDEVRVLFDDVQVNKWKGAQWIALGTSMTMVDSSYFSYVNQIMGLNGENRGVSGGGLTTSASAGNTTMQAIKAIENFKGLLTVEVGPNDFQHPLGKLGDVTEDTFYGCLYVAFETITQRTTARTVIMTMVNQWADTGGQERRSVQSQFQDYSSKRANMRKAIFEVAEWFALPVIDVQGESGMGGYLQNPNTSYDWIHPTEIGGEVMGRFIVQQLQNRINPFPKNLKLYTE